MRLRRPGQLLSLGVHLLMKGFSGLVSTVVDVVHQDLADPLLEVPFGEVFLEPFYQVLVVIEKEVALAKHSGHVEGVS